MCKCAGACVPCGGQRATFRVTSLLLVGGHQAIRIACKVVSLTKASHWPSYFKIYFLPFLLMWSCSQCFTYLEIFYYKTELFREKHNILHAPH